MTRFAFLRRWWQRYTLQVVTGVGIVALAMYLQTTQAWLVQELHRGIWGRRVPDTQLMDARVLELEIQVQELQAQNRQLQQLLGYQQKLPLATVAAMVVGRSAGHWWHQLWVGEGHRKGITPGAVVLAPGGLVGRVLDVTPQTSRVLLLTDPSSKVGVMVNRSRAMGVLVGQGTGQPVVEFFDKHPDVKPGDALVTSSFSTLFPPGIPVGKVESIDWRAMPAPRATVQLNAPIERLEWVLLHCYGQTSAELLAP
ncbi:MAG: rod shape-determining protein MreC [Gloeomargarita sp. SKYBB_i_bin120]|nr:rod shape-determining protein MreC [Gloeomargarita sp. SKYG98]MCS7291626.1 rod shape-determining protein MreC [Gloeomargarita sp. SKYB120]MDW8177185.1 rod shape-determining protein MreC [Gloeomargarita sp. SKYBB_i_bin120]